VRPEALFTCFSDILSLSGVGPRSRTLFERLGITRLVHLLWHFPSGLIDRRYRPKIMDAEEGTLVTLEVEVVEHHVPPNKRMPYRVTCRDDSGFITLVFFKAHRDYLAKQLPSGEMRLISGKLEKFKGVPQITHPDYIVDPNNAGDLPLLEPVYPLTAALSGKIVRKAVAEAVKRAPDLVEWQDTSFKEKQGWGSFKEMLSEVHSPESHDDLASSTLARRRLAYDELLATQLTLALVRERARRNAGRALKGDGHLRTALMDVLPYALTGDQQTVVGEIEADMMSKNAMIRLVQGDVGSGKTIVALMAMLNAVETGAQAALLAPTEILARQHMATLTEHAETLDIRIEILTGRNKGKKRDALLADLAAGDIDILIGTHAIIQSDVVFKDLGLAVIDEQHRFGVQQRIALTDKADKGVDVLAMTATPIPRTLTLTAYGDMDISRIAEKPPGRKPIDTRVVSLDRLPAVVDGVKRAVEAGARAYWVCPLVEESLELDVAAAEERFAHLRGLFGERVGLVHGQMKAKDKDAVMQAFAEGDIDMLVSTTVIEVGVDVPEATVMVIEHAERFGLSQLHQLRGRVGRGTGKSSCLLLRSAAVGEVASARLKIMRESEDGFLIAEEDLRLRGAGELLGTRQSGLPDMRVANLIDHADLIPIANDDARMMVSKDPMLKTPRGEALRVLLYLFERDEAVKLMKSG